MLAAANTDDPDFITALIELGADVNLVSNLDKTALDEESRALYESINISQ